MCVPVYDAQECQWFLSPMATPNHAILAPPGRRNCFARPFNGFNVPHDAKSVTVPKHLGTPGAVEELVGEDGWYGLAARNWGFFLVVVVSELSGAHLYLFGSILALQLIYVVRFLFVRWGGYQQCMYVIWLSYQIMGL